MRSKNRIADLRREHGYSQFQLAKLLGVAQNTISNWEQGKREPDYSSMKKLAYYLGCSTDYLMGSSTIGRTFAFKDSSEPIDSGQIYSKFPAVNRTIALLLNELNLLAEQAEEMEVYDAFFNNPACEIFPEYIVNTLSDAVKRCHWILEHIDMFKETDVIDGSKVLFCLGDKGNTGQNEK